MKIRIVEHKDGRVDVLLTSSYGHGEQVTEEKFEKLLDEYHALIKPIRDRRALDREKAKEAEDAIKRAAAQRVIDVDGIKVRVQKHYGHGMDHDTSAWRDGCDPQSEDTLWRVQVDGLQSSKPWTIEGPIYKRRYDGFALRHKVSDAGGRARRYASIEAAVKRALEIELAGGFTHPGKIERPKPYA